MTNTVSISSFLLYAAHSSTPQLFLNLQTIVQLIFSVLLQHHIPKLPRYFWSTLRSVHISAPYKAVLQMYHFTAFFLKIKSNFLVKRDFFFFFMLNGAFAMTIVRVIPVYSLHHLLSCYPNSFNIPHPLIVFHLRSRVQQFPAWHTKAAPNGKCLEGYTVPSMVRLMYQLKSVLK